MRDEHEACGVCDRDACVDRSITRRQGQSPTGQDRNTVCINVCNILNFVLCCDR